MWWLIFGGQLMWLAVREPTVLCNKYGRNLIVGVNVAFFFNRKRFHWLGLMLH